MPNVPAVLVGGPLHAELFDADEDATEVTRDYRDKGGAHVLAYRYIGQIVTDPQGVARRMFDWVKPA